MGKHVALVHIDSHDLKETASELRNMAYYLPHGAKPHTPAQIIKENVKAARKILIDSADDMAKNHINPTSTEEDKHYDDILESVTLSVTSIYDETGFIDNNLPRMLSTDDIARMQIYAKEIFESTRRIYASSSSMRSVGLAYLHVQDDMASQNFLPDLFEQATILSIANGQFEAALSEYLLTATAPHEPDLFDELS